MALTDDPLAHAGELSASQPPGSATDSDGKGAPAPDWEGFLRDAALLFEAEPDLSVVDAVLEPDSGDAPGAAGAAAASGERLPDGFRLLRARLFVGAKPGKSLPAGCALALLLAAQTSWIERGIARLPAAGEGFGAPGPAPFLRLCWLSSWPLSEASFDATFGPDSAFADKALSWFFPADPNAPRGVEPYRTAQFMRRAPEFVRLAQADHQLRLERQKALSHLPPAGSVSFSEALRLAREERALANMAPPAKVGRFALAEPVEPIARPAAGRSAAQGNGRSVEKGRFVAATQH